jgi:arylsulfatase A-like enzyme
MKIIPLLGSFCFLYSAHFLKAAEPSHPNILFIFADDQRADTIAALGNTVIKTPSLDRLVKRGVSFDRAYMQGGTHGATCVASRAMLLSGQSLFHIDEKLKRDQTWPAAFRDAGYLTFISGKWHNGDDSVPKSFEVAKKVFTGGMANPLKIPLSDYVDGKMAAPTMQKDKHGCETFAEEAIAFLTQKNDRPFFCYVPFDGPHDPHIVPDDFPIRYAAKDIPLPTNFLPQHPFNNGEMVIRDEELLPWPRSKEEIQQMLADYYRYISYLDSLIGRMLDALDKSPAAKNTIIVFSADSGVARGSHGLIGKQNLYEHSLRVPLIIAGPGIAENQRSQAMCYLYDVLPTLGELCQVKFPPKSDGISFVKTLSNPSEKARDQLYFGYRDLQRGIRDDRWKLIHYPKSNTTQLFDLKNDPYEVNDLASNPDYTEQEKTMMAHLVKQQQLSDDKAPLTVKNPLPSAWTAPKAKNKK